MQAVDALGLRYRPWGVEIVDDRGRTVREFPYPKAPGGRTSGQRAVRERARRALDRMEATAHA